MTATQKSPQGLFCVAYLYFLALSVSVLRGEFFDSGDAGRDGGFGYGFCDCGGDDGVEDVSDDVVGVHGFRIDEVGQGVGGGDFHFFIDLACADVEGAAEEAGEYAGVIDLVRHVAAAGAEDIDAGFARVFEHHFGYGVCHAEDDVLFGHEFNIFDFEESGAGAADEDVRAGDGIAECAGLVFRIDFFLQGFLDAIEVSVVMKNAVDFDDGHFRGIDAAGEEEACDGAAGGSGSVHDDFDVADAFADEFQAAQDARDGGNGGTVLVVVEDGDAHRFFQTVFNVVAFGRGNIFEVDAGERFFQKLYTVNKFFGIFRIDDNRNGVDVSETFIEGAFPFHDGDRCGGADVAEAEDAGAVGDDGDDVSSPGVFEREVFVFFNRQARRGDAGCVDDGEVVRVIDIGRECGADGLVLGASEFHCFFF